MYECMKCCSRSYELAPGAYTVCADEEDGLAYVPFCSQCEDAGKLTEAWILAAAEMAADMVENCTQTNCLGCEYGKYPGCPLLDIKRKYMGKDGGR